MSLPSHRSVDTVRQVPERTDDDEGATSPITGSSPRRISIQRLAAPVPVVTRSMSEDSSVIDDASLAGPSRASPGPGRSAIAAGLASYGRSPSNHGTPATREISPGPVPSERAALLGSPSGLSYGTPSQAARQGSPRPVEDRDAVMRMLVQPEDVGRPHRDTSTPRISSNRGSRAPSVAAGAQLPDPGAAGPGLNPDEFSSLQLQGGDMTRDVYRLAHGNDARSVRNQRSRSFIQRRPQADEFWNVRQPGGLRRNYLDRHGRRRSPSVSESAIVDEEQASRPRHHASSFMEHLILYSHFGGEELNEEDEYDLVDDLAGDEDEGRPLLRRRATAADRRRQKTLSGQHGNASAGNAVATLLKSFVGTGVLFLPRAFLNGGMLFSSITLVLVSVLSYYCFILLVTSQSKIGGSFGDMGEQLYGRWLRLLILGSLVLSQIGFVSAYIVFTSENLIAFIEAVSKCTKSIDIKWMILLQIVVLMPFSLIRKISKLAFTAYIADVFIVLGLIYLYSEDVSTLSQKGAADIKNFNPSSWTLFIGTAIFTFEGVGLILPIQESMREPHKFPVVLAGVMVFITVVFTSAGALSYAAFGSKTKTVILLNMPQDSVFVNAVQLLYSAAILLSTPLQLFPAIRILEQGLFKPSVSGQSDLKVKWLKNFFRFAMCIGCALIAWLGANDLDKFVSLVGSFACIPLVYWYPPMLHLKAVARTRLQKTIDYALIFVGVFFMFYTLAQNAISWSKGSSPSPGYCDTKKVL